MGRSCIRGKVKAQSSIEAILITAMAIFILTALVGIVYDQISTFYLEQDQKIASVAVNTLAREINDVYFMGPGTIKTLLVRMPSNIDFSKSSIEGRMLVLNVGGSDIFASTKVDVRGIWPDQTGTYSFTITAHNDYVSISVRPVNVSLNQISEYLIQGESTDFNLVLSNVSSQTHSYSMILDFPSPSLSEVELTSTQVGLIELSSEEVKTISYSISCKNDSFGSYSGGIVFVPSNSSDANITVPVNLFCSSAQTKLNVYPSSKNFYTITGSVTSDSVLVCNTTSRDFASTSVNVSGSIAPFVVTSFSDGISANSCSTVPFVVNAPLEVLNYDGVLFVNSGGYTQGIDLNLVLYSPTEGIEFDWSNAYFSSDGNVIYDVNIFALAGPFTITHAMILFQNDLDDANITGLYFNSQNTFPLGTKATVGEWVDINNFDLNKRKSYDLNITFDSNVINDSEKFRIVLKSSEGIYFWSTIFDPTNSIIDNNISHFSNLSKGQEPIYPRDENLVALWRLNDMNSDGWVLNSVGSVRNSQLKNGADVNGIGQWDNNCGWFDGVDAWIDTGDLEGLHNTRNLTLSAWIYPNTSGSVFSENSTAGWTDNQIEVVGTDVLYKVWNTSIVTISGVNLNAWNFVALVYDDSTLTLTGYLNSSSSSLNVTQRQHPIFNYGQLVYSYGIGQNGGTSLGSNAYFSGKIDDVAIWNTALSAEEVREIYSIGSGVHDFNVQADGNGLYLSNSEDGNFVLDGNFYSRVFDLNGMVDFNELTFSKNQIGSDNAYSKISNSDFNNNYLVANLSSVPANQTYFAATGELDWNKDGNYSINGSSWDLNLKAYYKFNSKDGTTIYDSARGKNGSLNGGADINGIGVWDTNAAWFNALTGYISIPNYSHDGNSLTITAWIYPTTLSGERGILTSNGFMFETNNSVLRLYSNIYAGSTANSTTSLNLNQWNYVAVTFTNPGGLSNNSVTFYTNGERESFTLNNYLYGTTLLRIGNYFGGNRFFGGLIDEVKIYNRVLSFSELDNDYNSFLNAKFIYKNSFDSNDITDWNSILINPDTNYSFGREISASEKFGDDLTGLWHMNESSGTNVADSSGKGNNGTASFEKSGGYSVSYDGDYTVYTFSQSATFTPTVPLSDVEVLVVGGGGAGGGAIGGGGGAGGLIHTTIDLSAQSYPVTVGQGALIHGTSGYSFFADLNAFGGGNGSDGIAYNQQNGGSGGGQGAGAGDIAQGTDGQGNDGGQTTNYLCGGGGGAGAVGGNGNAGTGYAGAGGAGLAYDINGTLIYYAAGGAGGGFNETGQALGGSGIGGNGGYGSNAQTYGTNGLDGTGSGGGGGGWLGGWALNENGGAGGDGIVIIRFLTSQMPLESTGLWNTESITLDGTDDYVSIDDASSSYVGASSAVTLSAWVKPTALSGYRAIFVHGQSGACFNYGLVLIGGVPYFRNTNNDYSFASAAINLNRWTHLVMTSNGSNSYLYVNGIYSGAVAQVSNACSTQKASIGIRSYNSVSEQFSGSIEEVALWNRTLSSSEIVDLYRKGISRLDLNVYSCSDANCENRTGSQYIENVLTSSPVDLNSDVKNSRYLGLEGYFKKGSDFEDSNANFFWAGSFIKDFNVMVNASKVLIYSRASTNGYSWGDWSDSASVSPKDLDFNGNYFQYKSILSRVNPNSSPALSDVNITYNRLDD